MSLSYPKKKAIARQKVLSRTVPTVLPAPEGMEGDQRELWDIFEKHKVIALKKNMDYGSSVFKKPVLCPDSDLDTAIRTRMSDKVERLVNLLKGNEQQVQDESMDDTIGDLGTYCFLLLIAREKMRGERNRDE